MKIKAKVGDLKNLVVLAKHKAELGVGEDTKRKELFDRALLIAKDNHIEIHQAVLNLMRVSVNYELDEGKVIEEGEVGVDLEAFEVALKNFSDTDTVTVTTDGQKVVLVREKPRREVYIEALSDVEFGDVNRASILGVEFTKDKIKDVAVSGEEHEVDVKARVTNLPVEDLYDAINAGSFTEADTIQLNLNGAKLQVVVERDIRGSVSDLDGAIIQGNGKFYAKFGFDNIISTLKKFGGLVDIYFTDTTFYFNYESARFKYVAKLAQAKPSEEV